MAWIGFVLLGAVSGLVFPVAFRASRQWRVRAAELGALVGVVAAAVVWVGGRHYSATLATALWASLAFAMVAGWALAEMSRWEAGVPRPLGAAGPAGPAAPVGLAEPVGLAGPAGPEGPAEAPDQPQPAEAPDQPGVAAGREQPEPPEDAAGS